MQHAQPSLFDHAQAEASARHGIARVTRANQSFLEAARAIAAQLARRHGQVTADTLRAACERRGLTPRHFNAWGAVFSYNTQLRWSGRFEKSALVQGHGNLQRVWVLA